jgi:hypothetical protein
MDPIGTSNRKGKRIPNYFLIAVSFLFRHNNSMKIEIPDYTIEQIKKCIALDKNEEVTQEDVEYRIADLICSWIEQVEEEW